MPSGHNKVNPAPQRGRSTSSEPERLWPPARLPGEDIADEWRATVAHQARTLEDILRRFHDAATRVRRRGGNPQHQTALFRELAAEAEGVFAEEAQQNVALEQEIAQYRALCTDTVHVPQEATQLLRVMERVNAVLHANLVTARRVLATMVQSEK